MSDGDRRDPDQLAGAQLPRISLNGVVNGASFAGGEGVAPGAIVTYLTNPELNEGARGFDILGDPAATAWFSKISVASFRQADRGHTGNYFGMMKPSMVEMGIRDDYIVLVGGAPLNEEFGKAIGADAYCRDAAVAVETAKDFMSRKHNQLAAG